MHTTVVLLAAGRSQRFGGIKQLANINGSVLINSTLKSFFKDEILMDGVNDLFVVLGANSRLIESVLPEYISTFTSQNWQAGMGSSLSESMANIPKHTSHILIGLADQIAIKQGDIRRLLEVSKCSPEKIIAAKYDNQIGAPVIFPRAYFSCLRQLNGDRGAKPVLKQNMHKVISVDMLNASYDIDTMEDLELYLSQIS